MHSNLPPSEASIFFRFDHFGQTQVGGTSTLPHGTKSFLHMSYDSGVAIVVPKGGMTLAKNRLAGC